MPASPLRWQGSESPPWKVVACSVQGPGHRLDDTPCQDRFAYAVEGSRLVAVVSDGAGSAEAAELGANAVAEGMAARLARLPLDPVSDAPELWRPAVEAAIEDLRAELAGLARATGRSEDLSAFHATLVAAVATPSGGLFIHVGDGTAQAAGPPGEGADALAPVAASLPENGEEANSTYFVTLPFWRETLRLTRFGPARRIVLMSDGPMPFAAAKGAVALEPAFMAPVDAYLRQHPAEDGAEALAGTLDSPKAARLSPDDKTLVWAALV